MSRRSWAGTTRNAPTDGQRAALGAAERVVVVAELDVLSFGATRQADVVHEHVARVHAFPIARVGPSTAASAQVTRVVVAIARIVAPSRIVAIARRTSS